MPRPYCVILITSGNQEEAQQIANPLVSRWWAACAQITPITSTYGFQEKVNTASERLLPVKTTINRYRELETLVISHHRYDVPEISQIPISNGLSRYLGRIEGTPRPCN